MCGLRILKQMVRKYFSFWRIGGKGSSAFESRCPWRTGRRPGTVFGDLALSRPSAMSSTLRLRPEGSSGPNGERLPAAGERDFAAEISLGARRSARVDMFYGAGGAPRSRERDPKGQVGQASARVSWEQSNRAMDRPVGGETLAWALVGVGGAEGLPLRQDGVCRLVW